MPILSSSNQLKKHQITCYFLGYLLAVQQKNNQILADKRALLKNNIFAASFDLVTLIPSPLRKDSFASALAATLAARSGPRQPTREGGRRRGRSSFPSKSVGAVVVVNCPLAGWRHASKIQLKDFPFTRGFDLASPCHLKVL